MLNPGIYYPNKNAHRQLLAALPGRQVYPTNSNYIYYSTGSVYYVNRLPQYAIGTVVSIYLNGVLSGTTTVLDASGLYVYEFAPAYGTLEVKSLFPDGHTATQNYFCVNLYTLLAATAEVWGDYRENNIRLISDQFLTPGVTGIFRGQASQEIMNSNFGSAIGFLQPFDWSFEKYANAMGGTGPDAPSIYGALRKGASVGGIKDVVEAVTGYEMVDQDFTGLQTVGWQLGLTGNYSQRYRYSGVTGSPILDTDPGNTGVHYYLAYNQYGITFTTAAMLPVNATVVGAFSSATILAPFADSTHFCTTLTIDGVAFDDTLSHYYDGMLIMLRTPNGADFHAWHVGDPLWPPYAVLNTYADIATSIQTRIRFIGTNFNLGYGWINATVTHDDVNGRFLVRSGTAGASGSVGPIVGEDPAHPVYWSDAKRYSYVAGQDTVATIIGGTVTNFGATGSTAGVTYADQISLDGQQPVTTFHVPGPFTTGAQVAAAIQADMRRIGAQYQLKTGWTSCTCVYDTVNNHYIFKSGFVAPNGVIDLWTEGTGGAERPLLGVGNRALYMPGLTMFVWVNGDLIDSSRFYVSNDPTSGLSKLWISGLKPGDQVVANYTDHLGANQSISETVGQITGLAPIATLQSNIQQAYTILLNIVTDGFSVNGESVLRGLTGNADELTYDWLNPWGQNESYTVPKRQWYHVSQTAIGVTGDYVLGTTFAAQQGSEFVSINGNYLYPGDYHYGTPEELHIGPGVTLAAGDVIQWDFPLAGSTHTNYQETVTVAAAPYVITLAGPEPHAQDFHVFVNGSRLSAGNYLLAGNVLTIYDQLYVGDRILVRYITSGLSAFSELTDTNRVRNFQFDQAVDAASVQITINGEHAPNSAFNMIDPRTVQLTTAIYNALATTDIVSVFCDIALPAGADVTITQGITTYTQGVNFQVDYTHGKILWIAGEDQPAPGSAYQVYYVYFPKQILEQLLRLVQPATVRVLLQFTTTIGQTFNPYMWEGSINPSGNVILP